MQSRNTAQCIILNTYVAALAAYRLHFNRNKSATRQEGARRGHTWRGGKGRI